ncbi:replication initiator protein A, partial [Fusicatenibacter saccharivorans]|uniref:replication initiator protein A n=1 Tax=Fusicatenibacter saccharivorans TaxID=1150298 RepID=UPI0022E656DC
MEKKMTFNYFYGTEADQFSFYRIPKALFTDSYFKDLSSDAKILYGLMLDRMSLSINLNCGRNKAIKSMRELDDETGIGLIEKRRQGFGKVNVIYVKTFMPEKTDEKKFGEELEKFKKQTSVENEEPAEVYNLNFMKSQNQTSRSP